MADSYSGQLGREWGNYVAPTVQEDPWGSARDTAIGAIETISPIPTGLDKRVEHQDMYMTGMMFGMAFGGGVDDAIEAAGKAVIRKGTELIAKAKNAMTRAGALADGTKAAVNATDAIVDSMDAVGDMSKSDLSELIVNVGNGKTFESSYDIPVDANGNTKSSLTLGQEVHAEYKLDEVNQMTKFKEYTLPSKKRIDFIDFDTKTIYELKPNNPNQIRKGTKQLQEYLEEIEDLFGPGWTTILDTY